MTNQLTRVLSAVQQGDARAAGRLLPLVYDELRRLAAQRLAHEKAGHTLQATALVHEAYLRLVDVDETRHFDGRGHFFAAAAEAMRRILVESARRRQSQKRGGDWVRDDLDAVIAPEPNEQVLALDEALRKLAETDPLKAKLVELRYFAGLTSDQAAETLDISPSTADRHWAYARAWLRAAIEGR